MATAPTLHPKWVYPTPDSVTASPMVVGDTVYIGDWAGDFYALPADPPPGQVTPRWTFHVDDTNGVAFGRIVSTAAYVDVDGVHAVVFAGGATLYALDPSSGQELGRICIDPRADPAVRCHGSSGQVEIESSPAIVRRGNDTLLLVGMDVHNDQNVARTGVVELALHGANNTITFDPQWKFDPENGGAAYHGDGLLTANAGSGTGCGGVWSSPAVDVERDLVFFGTSSCSVTGVTTGEHVWGVSLATGDQRWSYGPPRTSTRYDDDFGASPNLLPGGLVGIGSKDGWYYALDEMSGAPAWTTHVGESGHVFTDFAVGGVLGSSATAPVNGQQLIFVTTAISTPLGAPLDDNPSLDQTLLQDPTRLFSLSALRASDGAVVWRQPLSRQSYGAPTVVNGVVLVPSTFDFSIGAYAADTGLPLGSWPVGGAPSSSPTASGNSVYVGAGTRTTDVEYKAFGADAASSVLGASPLSPLSGVWAFRAGI